MNINEPTNPFEPHPHDPSPFNPPPRDPRQSGPAYGPAPSSPSSSQTPPPPPFMGTPNGMPYGTYAAGPAFIPPPTGELRPRRFTTEQIVATLLAAAGVVVTLVGVVLLLVMAAREGILTPGVRVGGGALGAAALAGAAAWVRPRTGGRLGSVALLATSAAVAYFDVSAVTRIYAWVPLSVGLVLAFVVGAATALLAMRWDEKWLFMGLTLAVALFAPALTNGLALALVAFLFVVQIAGIAPELTRGWDELSLVRTAPAVLAAACWTSAEHSVQAPVMAALVAGVAVLTILLTASVRPDAQYAAVAYVIGWLPVWVWAPHSQRMTWTLTLLATTAVAALVWWAVRHAGQALRLGALVAFVVNALMLAFALTTGTWMALPFLVTALVLFVAQGVQGRRAEGQLALGVLAVAVLVQQVASPAMDLFYRERTAALPVSVVISGLVMMAVAAVATWSVRGRGMSATHVQVTLAAAGSVSLLGFAMTLVAGLGRTPGSFFLTHLELTVSALALAATVLVSGLKRPRHLAASMGWGLTLVGCALLKLVAFDLSYMGAMTRAMTCVVAGIVLLAAGTMYARTYAVAARANKPMPQAGQSPGAPMGYAAATGHDGMGDEGMGFDNRGFGGSGFDGMGSDSGAYAPGSGWVPPRG